MGEEEVVGRSDEIMAASSYHVSVKDAEEISNLVCCDGMVYMGRGAVPPLEGTLDHDGGVPLVAVNVWLSLIAAISHYPCATYMLLFGQHGAPKNSKR